MSGHFLSDPINNTKAADEEALYNAAGCNKVDDVKRLLDLGVDPNCQGAFHWTPLHRAALNGHEQVCEVLLQPGAKVDALDDYQQTPLHFAAKYGFAQVCEVLLQHRAKVGALDNCQQTPLHIAAKYGFAPVCEVLLQHGADKNLRNKQGKTPLEVAQTSKDIENEEDRNATINVVTGF